MREIKLRVYDNHNKIMRYFDRYVLCNEYQSLCFVINSKSKMEDETEYCLNCDLGDLSNPMEYTGLKDKNGVDIYEGDILRCNDINEDHEEFITKVWFFNGQFLTTHYGFPVHSWSGKENSWCEVIGNIHQNYELLKGK